MKKGGGGGWLREEEEEERKMEAETGRWVVERNNQGVCGCLLLVPWLQAFYSLLTPAGTPGSS